MSLRDALWNALAASIVLAAACGGGCSRCYYRQSADNEVYGLVDVVGNNAKWCLTDFTIEFDPRSRFFFPYKQECPPMPPDDPYSNKLMHHVYKMRGYPCWGKNGYAKQVEAPDWRAYLPLDEEGVLVIDRRAAVQLARIHSRNYQSNLEELYLSALDVTFERFRFDAQFFGGNSLFYTADGRLRAGNAPARPAAITGSGGSVVRPVAPSRTSGNASSVLRHDAAFQGQRLYASGGQLVSGVANSLVWQFAGDGSYENNTLLDFSIVQPLLRFGGRPRVLERLTLSERTLLANARQMEFYRRGFVVDLLTGAVNPQGPSRRGGVFGGAGLEGFSGVGGAGFGRVTATGGGGAAALGGNTGAGAQRAGGFYGLLQQAREIANQEVNVAALRDSLAQFEAAYDAGRINRFQVDQARQQLYLAQSALLISKTNYQQQLDAYKFQLGLPPSLELRADDPMLARFQLVDPRLAQIQNQINDILDVLRDPTVDVSRETLAANLTEAQAIRALVGAQIGVVEGDFLILRQSLPRRRAWLEKLSKREDVREGAVEVSAYDQGALDTTLELLTDDFEAVSRRFDEATAGLVELEEAFGSLPPADARRRLVELMTSLSSQLSDLLLVQARARLNAATLVPVDISSGRAYQLACQNRLDWMNARATLVDIWRLIEFNANALESDLNVVFSGDLSNTTHNPVRLRGSTGRLRVGVEFDAPLTRVFERNTFRQSLIEYQQARRQYLAFTDQVSFVIRNRVRQITLDQLNFEVRRAAVDIAISQVEQTRARLDQPPAPGETSTLGPTTARDLVDALTTLLNAQNDFLSIWVNYEVQRMALDFDMGTMQLDAFGMWIDPGPINEPDDPDCDPDSTFPWEALPPGTTTDGDPSSDETLPEPAADSAVY